MQKSETLPKLHFSQGKFFKKEEEKICKNGGCLKEIVYNSKKFRRIKKKISRIFKKIERGHGGI